MLSNSRTPELKFFQVESIEISIESSRSRTSELKSSGSRSFDVKSFRRVGLKFHQLNAWNSQRFRAREKQTPGKNKGKLYAIGRKYAKEQIYLAD